MPAAFITPEFEVRHVTDVYDTPVVRITMTSAGRRKHSLGKITPGSVDIPLAILDSLLEELQRARECWKNPE